MTGPVRLLDCGRVTYLRSQAIYHAVADAMSVDAPDTLILCTPDLPHFCVGFHQDPRQELDLEFCREHDYPVLRRRVGGGTTYLDPNQLYYQFVFYHSHAPAMVDALYRFALAAPVEALRELGLQVELRDVNEIVVNGKRMAGTGAGRIGEASVVVGNFLFDFDYEVMARAWRVPDETFRRLARDGLEKYLTTIRREMSDPPSMDQTKSILMKKVASTLGRELDPGQLSPREQALAVEAEGELSSMERLLELDNPERRGLKIAGGVWVMHATTFLLVGGSDGALDITARVRENTIDALAIEPQGGFGGRLWDLLADSLRGLPLDHAALSGSIARFQDAGVIPGEINLDPLVKTLVKMRS